jgi:hypothetical protein
MNLLHRNGKGKGRRSKGDGSVIQKEERQYHQKEKNNNSTRARDSTEILLRMIWELIIWPLILEINRTHFSVEEYRLKMAEFCEIYEIQPPKISGLLIAIVAKGLLTKRGNIFSIHSRHVQYMQMKINLGYGLAVKEAYTKE